MCAGQQSNGSLKGYAFFLPAHKADTAFKGNKVIILSDDDPTFNPLPVFRRYLALRDAQHLVHPALWVTAAGSCPHAHLVYEKTATIFPDRKIAGQSMQAGGCYRSRRARCAPIPYTGAWSLVLCRIQDIHSEESCHPSSHDRHSSSLYLTPPRAFPTHLQFYYPLALIHAVPGSRI